MAGSAFSAVSDSIGSVDAAAAAGAADAGIGADLAGSFAGAAAPVAADVTGGTAGDITAAFMAGGPSAFMATPADLAAASSSVFPGIAGATTATAADILSGGSFNQLAGLGGGTSALGGGTGASALSGVSPAAQALAGTGNPVAPSLSAPAVSQPPPAVTGGAGAAGAGTSGVGGAAAVAAPPGVALDPANTGLSDPNLPSRLYPSLAGQDVNITGGAFAGQPPQAFGDRTPGIPTSNFDPRFGSTPLPVGGGPFQPLATTPIAPYSPQTDVTLFYPNAGPPLGATPPPYLSGGSANPIASLSAGTPDTSALGGAGQALGDIGAGVTGVGGTSAPGTTGWVDPAYGSFVPPPAAPPPSSDIFNAETAPAPQFNQLSPWGIQTPSLAGVSPTLGGPSPLAGSVTTGGGDLGSNITMNAATPVLPGGSVTTGGGDLGSTAAMTAQLRQPPSYATDFAGGQGTLVPSREQIAAQTGGYVPLSGSVTTGGGDLGSNADMTTAMVQNLLPPALSTEPTGTFTSADLLSPNLPATPVPPDQMLIPQIPNSPLAADYVAANLGGAPAVTSPLVPPDQLLANAQTRALQSTDVAPFANAPADAPAPPAGYNPAAPYIGNAPLAGSSDWQRVAATPVPTTNIGGATADLSPAATPSTPAALAGDDASRAASPGISDVISQERLTAPYSGASNFAVEQTTGLFPGTTGAAPTPPTVAQLDTATPSADPIPYDTAPGSVPASGRPEGPATADVNAPATVAASEAPSVAGGGTGGGGKVVPTVAGSPATDSALAFNPNTGAAIPSAASSTTAGKPWWQPYMAPAAALGAGAATLALNPGGPLSGIFGSSNQYPYPGEAQIAQEAQQAQTQSGQLQGYLASGTLPPGMQASLNAAQADAITAIKSKYAGMGMSGSSAEQQDIQNLRQRIVAQSGDMALQLFQQGANEAQLSSQLYTEIMNQAIAQDQALSQSIGSIAGALASLAVPLLTGL